MLPTPLVPALCPEHRGAAVIAYCTRVPPHPTFVTYLLMVFLAAPSSCQSLIMFFYSHATTPFSRCITCVLVGSLCTFHLSFQPSNQSSSPRLASSFLCSFSSSTQVFSSASVFLQGAQWIRLIVLIGSLHSSDWFVSGLLFLSPRLSRRLQSICLCLNALLSAVTQNAQRSNSGLPVTSCCHSAVPRSFVCLFVCLLFLFNCRIFILHFHLLMYIISENVPEAPAHCHREAQAFTPLFKQFLSLAFCIIIQKPTWDVSFNC